jgi:hypothetical protein
MSTIPSRQGQAELYSKFIVAMFKQMPIGEGDRELEERLVREELI